jgi:hypothetical protein
MEKLNGLLMLLSSQGIIELARTGMVALERGAKALTIQSVKNKKAHNIKEQHE